MPTQARAFLENFAKRRIPITYQALAKALQILPPHSIRQVTEALERLMEEDAAADRPFIAALAISKARSGLPAPGFFDCARRLGRFAGDPDGQDAWSFHAAELTRSSVAGAVRATTNSDDMMSTEINPIPRRDGRLSKPLVNHNGLSRCPTAAIRSSETTAASLKSASG